MKLRISYEFNNALIYRARTRIFGNIDTDIRQLDMSEIVSYEMHKVFNKEAVQNLFERDSTFYHQIINQ